MKAVAKASFAAVDTLFWGRLSPDSSQLIDSSYMEGRATANSNVQRQAQQLAILMSELKKTVRMSKHGVCIMTTNRDYGPDIDIWEPEFDVKALEATHENLRDPRSCFSENYVQRF
jgi:hypothetical protein